MYFHPFLLTFLLAPQPFLIIVVLIHPFHHSYRFPCLPYLPSLPFLLYLYLLTSYPPYPPYRSSPSRVRQLLLPLCMAGLMLFVHVYATVGTGGW